eukprot:SAG22_NODE_10_length_35702_cov_72.266992_13_plen_429_part_00
MACQHQPGIQPGEDVVGPRPGPLPPHPFPPMKTSTANMITLALFAAAAAAALVAAAPETAAAAAAADHAAGRATNGSAPSAPCDTSGGWHPGASKGKSYPLGFLGIAIAAIGFGSNFVVIKNKEWGPGDGMFFQFNMVVGVFMTGLLYHFFVRGAPPLQPFAMLGGAGWAIGNAACPFIIDTIGMGLGLSIWGTANLVTGWSSAHFGILLVAQETVPKPALNIAAMPVAILAILIYAQVRNVPEGEESTPEEQAGLINGGGAPEKPKKAPAVVGVAVACVAGVLFGACFNPAQHVSDLSEKNYCKAIADECSCVHFSTYKDPRVYCSWEPPVGNATGVCGGVPTADMAFSQFCGIFIASFTILAVWGFYQQFVVGQRTAAPGDEGQKVSLASWPVYINSPLLVLPNALPARPAGCRYCMASNYRLSSC